MAEEKNRTILVTNTKGKVFRITFPESCKVTFGITPNSHDPAKSLRIYDTKDKQRACFVEVHSFRDLGLTLEYPVEKPDGSTAWIVDDGTPQGHETLDKLRALAEDSKDGSAIVVTDPLMASFDRAYATARKKRAKQVLADQ